MSNNQTTGVYMQFAKDAASTFVLVLRFAALMVRINIYDTVEDLLDSNYIFLCEFQDEYYHDGILYRSVDYALTEMCILESQLSIKNYAELLDYDAIWIYILICGHAVSIILFILEAAGRALLGFFIIYLIIFEMQAINRSYTEDSFASNEKTNK